MIYEIHEIDNRFKEYEFSDDDILVFDDALYSQYKFFDLIQNVNCIKYFAVSPYLLNIDEIQELNNRNIAMWKFKECHKRNSFMTKNQIIEISKEDNCFISIHGYKHIKFEDIYNKFYRKNLKNIKELIEIFNNDIQLAINWFENNIGYIPNTYCFPYNFTCDGLFKSYIIKNYSFITSFFDSNRKCLNFYEKI